MTANESIQQLEQPSELRPLIEGFRADQGSLSRLYTVDLSPARRSRLRTHYTSWLKRAEDMNFSSLSHPGQVDSILFRNHLRKELRQLELKEKEEQEAEPLLPFAGTVIGLEEARKRMEPLDPAKAAETLNALTASIKATRSKIGEGLTADKFVGNRAAASVRSLRETLKAWYGFYNGYDPMFTWWAAVPYKAADEELQNYFNVLREKLVGVKPDDAQAIVGSPIGREALLAELQFEMIPYTPEELIAIAEREYAWCLVEAKKASREMGFGDDWRKGMEHVKTLHAKPGDQPELIRKLAIEAIEFLEARDLVTIPAVAKETWRMEMMSPERQLTSPFFLGGETILVSFPTNAMTHEQKLMSMRANNIHFARATVQHELIPGHHLQGFMNNRNRTYRNLFYTPFWIEGWALYWEMLLWDLGFAKPPEDRMGMLFWRMHRCARIIFSLKFHLEQMSAQEAIDLLVETVGHERASAEGEVRRSFAGQYGPLYQIAYMIGGLQFRSMYGELVGSRQMTARQFHDAILRENTMPVEMLRAILTKQKLTSDFRTKWRFDPGKA